MEKLTYRHNEGDEFHFILRGDEIVDQFDTEEMAHWFMDYCNLLHKGKYDFVVKQEAAIAFMHRKDNGGRRMVYFINELKRDANGGYIPCIAVEDEPGYYPTDWNWGTDLEFAKELANEMNIKMGYYRKEAMLIQLSTMRRGVE